MKKYLSILLLFSFAALLWGCHFSASDPDSSFYWLPEESGFVDYEINGDCVRFWYRICFVNEDQQDIKVKLSAAFSGSELTGWVASKEYFDGLDDEGQWSYRTVKASGKTELVYIFEGKYLGGEVNTDLAFPEELMVATASASAAE